MFVTAVTSGTFDAAAGFAATADLVIGCVLGGWDFGLQGFTTLAPLGTMWFGLGTRSTTSVSLLDRRREGRRHSPNNPPISS